jgi:hypothetical protein
MLQKMDKPAVAQPAEKVEKTQQQPEAALLKSTARHPFLTGRAVSANTRISNLISSLSDISSSLNRLQE